MDANTSPVSTGLPALSPVQAELFRVLGNGGKADERVAAREMSVDIGEFRQMVTKLARHLDLPIQKTPAAEFSQLASRAVQFADSQVVSVKHARGNGSGIEALSAWQGKLADVARAIAKGVLISVDPYKIRPMRGQPREYFPEDEQAALETSFGMMGQVQDAIIRKKAPPRQSDGSPAVQGSEERVWRMSETEYELCDGERRWRGAMGKGLIEIRAKLIEIDDEGAYLVAAVSNFNRVGHTTLERARHIKRLKEGATPFPIEAIAAMQGISVATAQKLLNALDLPPDIQELMDPTIQHARGQDVLGKMPTYELARLGSDPVLHEHARYLARRVVAREMKMPELRAEVDRVLARSGSPRGVIAERNQPARRLHLAETRISQAYDSLRSAKGILEDLKNEGTLPGSASKIVNDIEGIADIATSVLKIVSAERDEKKK